MEPTHRLEDLTLLALSCSAIHSRRAQGHAYALEAHKVSSDVYGRHSAKTVALLEQLPSLQGVAIPMERFRVRRGSGTPRMLQGRPWK